MRHLPRAFLCLVFSLWSFVFLASADWRLALPGWQYEFPRDHFPHADFKTEWWYFTGNLRAADGRRFGYQLTFFRQGILPPGQRRGAESRDLTGPTESPDGSGGDEAARTGRTFALRGG